MKTLFLLVLLCSSLCAQENDSYQIVLLGNGEVDGKETIDEKSLIRLLEKIKEYNPDMLFFTGNLIEGLEESTTSESAAIFEKRLKNFSKVIHRHLGKEVPIYPVIGNHTFVNSRAVEIFKKHFKITDAAPLESYQLAYPVSLDKTQFIVMASGIFERHFRGYRKSWRSMPILDWLEKELKTHPERYKYRFVIGHLPAFSTGSSAGIYTGMDKDPQSRDAFWKVLRNNSALGYFSAHERIYDRSNRNGVWQLISGGLGARKETSDPNNVFQHFMLLRIPKDPSIHPTVRAIDLSGHEWDPFEIVPIDRPLHQLRISVGD